MSNKGLSEADDDDDDDERAADLNENYCHKD